MFAYGHTLHPWPCFGWKVIGKYQNYFYYNIYMLNAIPNVVLSPRYHLQTKDTMYSVHILSFDAPYK
jgi:hypothetical protein